MLGKCTIPVWHLLTSKDSLSCYVELDFPLLEFDQMGNKIVSKILLGLSVHLTKRFLELAKNFCFLNEIPEFSETTRKLIQMGSSRSVLPEKDVARGETSTVAEIESPALPVSSSLEVVDSESSSAAVDLKLKLDVMLFTIPITNDS